MTTFEVVVGDKLLDVPGRKLDPPSIMYDQVGVNSRFVLVIYAIVIGYESYFSKSKTKSSKS